MLHCVEMREIGSLSLSRSRALCLHVYLRILVAEFGWLMAEVRSEFKFRPQQKQADFVSLLQCFVTCVSTA